MKLATSSISVALAATTALAGLTLVSELAFAATGIDDDCPTSRKALAVNIAPPSLQADVVDYSGTEPQAGSDAAPARPLADADLRTSALLRQIAPKAEAEDTETADTREEPDGDLPPTATRIPGVADEHMPRFRRQMFRTDI